MNFALRSSYNTFGGYTLNDVKNPLRITLGAAPRSVKGDVVVRAGCGVISVCYGEGTIPQLHVALEQGDAWYEAVAFITDDTSSVLDLYGQDVAVITILGLLQALRQTEDIGQSGVIHFVLAGALLSECAWYDDSQINDYIWI